MNSLHMIQPFSPSLSDFSRLHMTGTKSDLLQCLKQPRQLEPLSSYDCKILDGAVIVHCLPTIKVSTLDKYADEVFIPFLQKQLQELGCCMGHLHPWQFEGVHLWKERSRCSQESLQPDKATRELDGISDPMNKEELFAFLTSRIEEFSWPPDKAVYVTSGQSVSSWFWQHHGLL